MLYLLQLVQALRYEALSDEEDKLTENTVDNLLEESIESQNSETPPTQGEFSINAHYIVMVGESGERTWKLQNVLVHREPC